MSASHRLRSRAIADASRESTAAAAATITTNGDDGDEYSDFRSYLKEDVSYDAIAVTAAVDTTTNDVTVTASADATTVVADVVATVVDIDAIVSYVVAPALGVVAPVADGFEEPVVVSSEETGAINSSSDFTATSVSPRVPLFAANSHAGDSAHKCFRNNRGVL